MTALLEKPAERNFEAQLIARAWYDASFKARLLADPKPAMEQELDLRLPEDLQVTVLEETPDSLHLVLPGNGVVHEERSPNGAACATRPERDLQDRLLNKARQDARFRRNCWPTRGRPSRRSWAFRYRPRCG